VTVAIYEFDGERYLRSAIFHDGEWVEGGERLSTVFIGVDEERVTEKRVFETFRRPDATAVRYDRPADAPKSLEADIQ
jgi:hypothetical protein